MKPANPLPPLTQMPKNIIELRTGERLVAAATYGFSSEKLGTSSVLAEVHCSASKHQPLWSIPPRAYAEVYRDSKGMRWYSVGGCWKTKATARTDEELEQERQETGTVIAHIPRDVWKAWTPRERRDRRAIVYDPSLTDSQALVCLLAWGAVEGAPPEPAWTTETSP
ncbi:hypothetical protein GALL_387750 [mine drainage metagenome]|uniref:Uncharacterized protein n=1 Tax=mine drainage metagenome TaxID=410659 RepID=A0A1J5Q752_9ZZZZ